MFRSKKERAFYVQVGLACAYTILRFIRADLSNYDAHFTALMALLASYHLSQAAIDYKHGENRENNH